MPETMSQTKNYFLFNRLAIVVSILAVQLSVLLLAAQARSDPSVFNLVAVCRYTCSLPSIVLQFFRLFFNEPAHDRQTRHFESPTTLTMAARVVLAVCVYNVEDGWNDVLVMVLASFDGRNSSWWLIEKHFFAQEITICLRYTVVF